MSARRMFTTDITDNDNFLLLSASAQALYLHLTMAADDEGFCNQVSLSMFKAHASVQDLEALIEKKYIIQFESGVVVIKHWNMGNKIRNDRAKRTVFQKERSLLELKSNGSYRLIEDDGQMSDKCPSNDGQMSTKCQPNVNQVSDKCPSNDGQMSAQYSIREDSIREDSIGEVSIGEDKVIKDKVVDCRLIADMYNETCVSFPRLTSLSDARKKAIKARLKTYTMDDFRTLFEKAEASSFLKGANDRNWSATFDWLISDKNMAKVLDGNYDNRDATPTGRRKTRAEQEMDAWMQMLKETVEEEANGGIKNGEASTLPFL